MADLTGNFSAKFSYSAEFQISENTGNEMTILPYPFPERPGIPERPPFGGNGDRTEFSELFEQKTGWMDRLVDAFNIDDTKVYEANGKTVIDAGMGSDEIKVTKNFGGGVTVNVNGREFTYTAEEAKNLEIRGGSGNDNITIDGKVKAGITVRGESGDDTIQGGGGHDRIYGGSGNDTIKGGRGNDYVHGGSGDDKVHGGRGRDQILGGTGSDELHGGRGNDNINGGHGSDKIYGDRGRDNITRDWQDSEVKGGKGDDDFAWDNPPIFRPLDFLRNWRA